MTNSPLANGDAAQNVRDQVSRRALVAGLASALGATAAATLGTAAPAEAANPPVLLSQDNTGSNAHRTDDQPGGLGGQGLFEPGANPQAVRQSQLIEDLQGRCQAPAAADRSPAAAQAFPKSASRLASHLRASGVFHWFARTRASL